jgi:lipopolysaccharide transport system permease protein
VTAGGEPERVALARRDGGIALIFATETFERERCTDHPNRGVAGGGPSTAVPEIVFERRSGWRVVDLGELWRYRELLFFLAWRDVKVRYKQTLLGASWAVLQPLMLMGAFTVFFSRMAGMSSGAVPYPLFALSGLLPWLFFAAAMNAAGNSVVGSERLITKVYFPRLLVPLSAIVASAVDFAVSLVLLAPMMAWYGAWPGAGLTLVPAIFGLILLLAIGLGTLLAALNVAYRDFKAVIPFLTQFWMFATPTIYLEPSRVSPSVLWLNPMAALVASFRAALLGGPIPWGPLAVAAGVAVTVGLIGCLYFRRSEQSFADLI